MFPSTMEVCKKCGKIFFGGGNCCGSKVKTDLTKEDLNAFDDAKRDAWKQHILDTIVFPSPEFNKKQFERRLQKEAEAEKLRPERGRQFNELIDRLQRDNAGKSDVAVCPRCGSTDIFLYQNKRNLIAIFRNKLYHVCANCKHKF